MKTVSLDFSILLNSVSEILFFIVFLLVEW